MGPDIITQKKVPDLRREIQKIGFELFTINWYHKEKGYGFFKKAGAEHDVFFHVKDGRIPIFDKETWALSLQLFPSDKFGKIKKSLPPKDPHNGDLIFAKLGQDPKRELPMAVSWCFEDQMAHLQAEVTKEVLEYNTRVQGLQTWLVLLKTRAPGVIYSDNKKKQMMQEWRTSTRTVFEGNNFQNLEESVRTLFPRLQHEYDKLCFFVRSGQKWDPVRCPFPELENFLQRAMTCAF